MFLLCHAASRLPVAREEQETRKPFDDTSSVAEEEEVERWRGGEEERWRGGEDADTVITNMGTRASALATYQ